MNSARTHFSHWEYDFSDEELTRYGSPYYDPKVAGGELSKSFFEHKAERISTAELLFEYAHLLCANEAFPEAALADPLSDLAVWDDWRTGRRQFPYPGSYSKLGIQYQEDKTVATSSVGVLGEIMAAVFSQAGIAPMVLVRVIRHWPDFIFYIGHDRYAFVESKAFTTLPKGELNDRRPVPAKVLAECLVNAVHQVNSDPLVQVWGAFTHIASIQPLELTVTFVELNAPKERLHGRPRLILPDAVVEGISQRALSGAARQLTDAQIKMLRDGKGALSKTARENLEEAIVSVCMAEVEGLLIDESLQAAILQSKDVIEDKLRKYARRALIPERRDGSIMIDALIESSGGKLKKLRPVGAEYLYIGALTPQIYGALVRSWQRSWSSACVPFGSSPVPLWRCGGALFALGDEHLDGLRY